MKHKAAYIGAIATALFALFTLCVGQCQQPYKVTWGKVGIWAGYSVAGALWGGREAYHADSHVFEKKWGVGERSFFGSQAWERQYENNAYFDGAKHKPELGNSFRDFWHFSGLSSRALIVGGTFTIGAGKEPLKHRLLTLTIGSVLSALSGGGTYNYLK